MKRVREHIDEKFTAKGDPIQDMGIGIPDYEVVMFDWKADGYEIAEEFETALAKFGIYITPDPGSEGSDQFVFILTNKKLTNE